MASTPRLHKALHTAPPAAAAQDVVLQMCVKIGLKDVDRFANCFCLCETRDGVTSA